MNTKTNPLPLHPMKKSDGAEMKEAIRQQARSIGFDLVGFAPAKLPSESPRLAEWLDRGYHGEMSWMEKDPSRRTDGERSFAGTETLLCCGLNYYQGPPEPSSALTGVISTYAHGEDYHDVLKEKLKRLALFISERFELPSKIYVDTGPLLEKGYAVAAGLGWLGKHGNAISRRGSSWFFLGEILLPIGLPPDAPERDHCGTGSRCIVACPTDAIVEPFVVDSRLCISYLTIEFRGFVPRHLRALIGNRIYGGIGTRATKRSAIRRARYPGLLRNVAIALGNSGDSRAVPALVEALDHLEPLVRGHAAWALGRLRQEQALAPLRHRLEREEENEVREEIEWSLRELRG